MDQDKVTNITSDLSSIANPLTALPKKGTKKLQWNCSGNQAFHHLKKIFMLAPILKHPDPYKHIFLTMTSATENTWQ